MGLLNPVTTVLPLRDSLQGRDRSGLFSATVTGPVRYDDNGLIVEPGTTNYMRSPAAGVSASEIFSNFASIDRETVLPGPLPGHLGPLVTTGYRVTVTDDVPPAATLCATGSTVVVGSAGVHMSHAYVWLPASLGTVGLMVRVFSFTNGTQAYAVNVDNSKRDQWQHVAWPTTVDASDLVGQWGITLVSGSLLPGDQLWFTCAAVQNEAVATSPAVGSMGPGYSWAGTPHASASVRALTVPTIPVAGHLDTVRGSMVARVRLTPPDLPTSRDILNVGSATTGDQLLLDAARMSSSIPTLSTRVNGSAFRRAVADGITVGQRIVHYGEWDDDHIGIATDDGSITTASRVEAPSGTVNGSTMRLGSVNTTIDILSGSLSDLAIYDDQLSDQRRAIVLDALANDADMDELWALFEEWEAVGLASDQLQLQSGNGTAGVTATATPMDLLQLQAGQGTAGVTAEGQAMEGVELKAGVGTLPYGYPARVTWRSP